MRTRLLVLTLLVMLAAIAPLSAQDGTAIIHTVVRGENLFRIARQYGTDINSIAQLNGIANTWQIFPGQTLIVPYAGVPAPAAEIAAAPAAAPAATQMHTVRRGEYLASIARQYGMTAEQLAALNGITNPNLIYAGQQLIVAASAAAPAPAEAQALPVNFPQASVQGEVRHLVRPGEYLSQIAQRYGISWLAIAQANGIYDPNTVFAGMELVIPGATTGITDAGVVALPPAPAAVVPTGRSIIVDLSDQRTYAYENGVLVRNVLVSTGLPATPTVLGSYTVQRKYAAQTMSGPDYYLPDVPYVMYFYAGYALHGTYWHSNFGQPMSHGCVNLPTPEAEWFYNWADYGTPVYVQM